MAIDIDSVLDALRTERECVCRDCDRECGKCDLAVERCWLLNMYDDAIALLTDYQPKRYAHWERGKVFNVCMCSACCHLELLKDACSMNYCPNCGASMSEPEEAASGVGQTFSP